MMSAHAGAAWLALGRADAMPTESVAGGAIEIDMAALGFAAADQVAAGVQAETVEPVETPTADATETAVAAEAVERAEPVRQTTEADRATEVERAAQAARVLPGPAETLTATRPEAGDVPPIESPRASEVTIAALAPAPLTEAEPAAETPHAVPAPVQQAEPVEEDEVAALVHVPLPTPRPDHTPAAMPQAEKPRAEPQRQPESQRTEPAPTKKQAQTPAKPRPSGSGGQNQTDARKGTAAGTEAARAAEQGKSAGARAGNAAVTNYPGQVASRLRRALRVPAAARRERPASDVHVAFTVDRSGGVSGIRIARSSGSGVIDQVAIDTVRRAAPFPPIPDGAGRSSWAFTVPLGLKR